MSHLRSPREIALFAYDDANAVDVFGTLQVFATACSLAKRDDAGPIYQTRLVTRRGEQIQLTTGTRILSDLTLSQLTESPPHTLLLAGGAPAADLAADESLVAELLPVCQGATQVASVCSGAFLLAATGLLARRRATTHWARYDLFRERFPDVDLQIDALWTRDGKFACSAGVSAGMDLALRLVEADFGRSLALATAREMVLFFQRPGGQNQFSQLTGLHNAASPVLRETQLWIENNLSLPLDVASLAERASMSVRNFSRRFAEETSVTPARYVALCRLHHARLALETSRTPIQRIASHCGYGHAEIMRRAFLRELGITPSDYRNRFPGENKP